MGNDAFVKVQTIGHLGFNAICNSIPSHGDVDTLAPYTLQLPTVYTEYVPWETLVVYPDLEMYHQAQMSSSPWKKPPYLINLVVIKDFARLKIVIQNPAGFGADVFYIGIHTLLIHGGNVLFQTISKSLNKMAGGIIDAKFVTQQIMKHSPCLHQVTQWVYAQWDVLKPFQADYKHIGSAAFNAWMSKIKELDLGDTPEIFTKYLYDLDTSLGEMTAGWEVDGGFSVASPHPDLGNDVTSALHAAIPGLRNVRTRCPACKSAKAANECDLSTTIIHLNDTHKWTREEIADWLEAQDWITELVFVQANEGRRNDHVRLD